ncbi:bifunctional phosphoglucose/phosphomannose isomerase [Candidatus Saccharibacteria bacterium]|nr:bifunctional phosphoglucose/phosphomannose isomerase [Candidatus Saccharibacteria bacterium]
MLDDKSYISRFDTDDALGVMMNQWQQLEKAFEIPSQQYDIENIVFVGMGGSALAAELSLVWPGYIVPFEICRNYTVPAYVGSKSLVIVSSYSGNTEEAISALEDAARKKSHIIVVSAGGALSELAKKHDANWVQLPTGLQPRHAVLFSFKVLVTILERCGFVKVADAEKSIHQTAEFLRASLGAWGPSVPTNDNSAKQLAEYCMGKTPIIYAGLLYPAAYKWKINFNENAKNTAWCGQYSEFNHNEFLGWSSHPIEKPFGVFDLISSFDHSQIKKRFLVSDKLLSGKRPKALQIHAEGETVLEQLLWTVALGDMVSVYLALLNGVNPTPVDLIEKLKKELA